jgi:hypothetical protein
LILLLQKEFCMAHVEPDPTPSRVLRGEILSRWEQLTTIDLEEGATNRSRLIDILQARYGFARKRAEKEVELFFGEFRDRLRLAA